MNNLLVIMKSHCNLYAFVHEYKLNILSFNNSILLTPGYTQSKYRSSSTVTRL